MPGERQPFWWEMLLRVADILWSCFIITPLILFYWAGTWKLMDLYLYSENPVYSAVLSLGIGTVACLIGYLCLPLLDQYFFHPEDPTRTNTNERTLQGSSIGHIIVSRISIYFIVLAVLNYWRGIWSLMDHYVGRGPQWNGVCLGASGLILLLLRSLGNAVAAPFFIQLDVSPRIYRPDTRFKVQPKHFWWYLGDSIFSHIVIHHLIVQAWRALMNVMENAIFPGDILLSYSICLGAGYGCAFIMFLLQHPLAIAAKKIKQISHWSVMLILQDLVHVAGVMVTLLVWRGGWGLIRDFLLYTWVDVMLAHGLASLGLLLVQSLTSASTLNLAVDAECGSTDSFYYSIDYFWYFWKRRQPPVLQVQVEHDRTSTQSLLEEMDDELINPS